MPTSETAAELSRMRDGFYPAIEQQKDVAIRAHDPALADLLLEREAIDIRIVAHVKERMRIR